MQIWKCNRITLNKTHHNITHLKSHQYTSEIDHIQLQNMLSMIGASAYKGGGVGWGLLELTRNSPPLPPSIPNLKYYIWMYIKLVGDVTDQIIDGTSYKNANKQRLCKPANLELKRNLQISLNLPFLVLEFMSNILTFCLNKFFLNLPHDYQLALSLAVECASSSFSMV